MVGYGANTSAGSPQSTASCLGSPIGRKGLGGPAQTARGLSPEAVVLPSLEGSLAEGTLLEKMAKAMGLGDSKEGCLNSRLSHIWTSLHGALRDWR